MRTIERTSIYVVLTMAPLIGMGCMLNRGGPPQLTRKEPKIFAVQREKPLSVHADTSKQKSPTDQSTKTDLQTATPEIASNDRVSAPSAKPKGKSSSTTTSAKMKKPENEAEVTAAATEVNRELKKTATNARANEVLTTSNVVFDESSTVTSAEFSDEPKNNPESSQIKLASHDESTESESEEIEFEIPQSVSSPARHPETLQRAWDAPDDDEIVESIESSASRKADQWSSPDGFDVEVEKSDEKDFQEFCLVKFKEERVFEPGLSEFTVEYRAQRYRFSSAEAAEKFQADPEQFVPHAGGLDIVAFGTNQEIVQGSLDFAVWYNQRLYLFNNNANISTFQRQPEKFAAIK